ncbi:hypothetical protein CsatA_015094 [Cannabis sativa]
MVLPSFSFPYSVGGMVKYMQKRPAEKTKKTSIAAANSHEENGNPLNLGFFPDEQSSFFSSAFQMVAAYSDGHIKVYELLDPLELKNWQLQSLLYSIGDEKKNINMFGIVHFGHAEFQNVSDSVSILSKASCMSASISWNPPRGESQELSFVLGFNSDTPQLNYSKALCAVDREPCVVELLSPTSSRRMRRRGPLVSPPTISGRISRNPTPANAPKKEKAPPPSSKPAKSGGGK